MIAEQLIDSYLYEGRKLARTNEAKAPVIVNDAHKLLKPLSPDPIDEFGDGVWDFSIQAEVDAILVLLKGAWKKVRDSTDKKFKRRIVIMRKKGAKKGSPELQINSGMYGGKAKVIIDTKP